MDFKAYVISIPGNIYVDDILESNTSLSEYIQNADKKEQLIYNIYQRILYHTVTKFTECQNSMLLFYLFIKYLKSTGFILGEIKTIGEDKIINVSTSAGTTHEATRNYILQRGLLNCVLGGLN